jgi:hypothetical protein
MANVRMGNVESLVHVVSGDFYLEKSDTFFLITDGIDYALVSVKDGNLVSNWMHKVPMEKHLNNPIYQYIHVPNTEIIVNK